MSITLASLSGKQSPKNRPRRTATAIAVNCGGVKPAAVLLAAAHTIVAAVQEATPLAHDRNTRAGVLTEETFAGTP